MHVCVCVGGGATASSSTVPCQVLQSTSMDTWFLLSGTGNVREIVGCIGGRLLEGTLKHNTKCGFHTDRSKIINNFPSIISLAVWMRPNVTKNLWT